MTMNFNTTKINDNYATLQQMYNELQSMNNPAEYGFSDSLYEETLSYVVKEMSRIQNETMIAECFDILADAHPDCFDYMLDSVIDIANYDESEVR